MARYPFFPPFPGRRGRFLLYGGIILAVILPLSLFFTGGMERVGDVEGPGQTIPPAASLFLKTPGLARAWTGFDLVLYVEEQEPPRHLWAAVGGAAKGTKPLRVEGGQVLFRLHSPTAPVFGVTIYNPTSKPLVLSRYRIKNYSAINTGFPRVAVLLTPYTVPAVDVGKAVCWGLIASSFALPGVLFLHRLRSTRNRLLLYGLLIFLPCLVLALGLFLRGVMGSQLLLSKEALFILFVPGSFLIFFTSRFFQERLLVPTGVTWILLTMGTLVSTLLGFGLSIQRFGPPLIYQKHFTQTALWTGLFYLPAVYALYRKKKEWFSPERHLLLSSLFLVFCPAFIIYSANGYCDYVGDTTFNSQLPWNLLTGKGFYYTKEYVAAHGNFGLQEAGGDKFLPKFPLGPGFLGLPTAFFQYLFSQEEANLLISWNQKVTAVWTAALSAALMYHILYRLSRSGWITGLLTTGYALGTTQLTISAATLWQHGPTVLFLSLGLLFLVKGQEDNPRYLDFSALPLAFLPLMRPQAALFYLAALATVFLLQPKRIPRFILFSLPGLASFLCIHWGLYHSLLGGSGYQAEAGHFTTPLHQGVSGLLFSPNRGLLVFSPFLILGLIGGGILWAKRSVWAVSFGTAACLFFLVHAKWVAWHGGYCVAPRFTSELIPLLVCFSVFPLLRLQRIIFILGVTFLILVSIAIHLPGFFFLFENGQWNVFPDVDRYSRERVWDYGDWLPIHFRHSLRLTRFQETPVYAFVVNGSPIPLKSEKHHFRVQVALEPRAVEVVKLTNVFLKKGTYTVLFRGDGRRAHEATAGLVVGFIGQKVEEETLSIPPDPFFSFGWKINMERAGYVDVRLLLSGEGSILLDTVQFRPET